MCDNILKLQKSGTDIFYEMITESHNNRLIYEFKEVYLLYNIIMNRNIYYHFKINVTKLKVMYLTLNIKNVKTN